MVPRKCRNENENRNGAWHHARHPSDAEHRIKYPYSIPVNGQFKYWREKNRLLNDPNTGDAWAIGKADAMVSKEQQQ